MTARNWCFTDFSPDEAIDVTKFKYIVWQMEKCPSSERVHKQGYFQLKDPVRIGGAKALLPLGCHLERQAGTNDQARDYCLKEESRFAVGVEHGVFVSGQGVKANLKLAATMTLSDVIEEMPHIYVQYNKGLERLQAAKVLPRTEPTMLTIIYGTPGSGKSRYVHEKEPDLFWIPVNDEGRLQWFDGYCGQEAAVADDYWFDLKGRTLLLRLADRYPLLVPCKGSFVNWRPKRMYITTNRHPKDWVDAAIERRCTDIFIYEMTDGVVSVSKWTGNTLPSTLSAITD